MNVILVIIGRVSIFGFALLGAYIGFEGSFSLVALFDIDAHAKGPTPVIESIMMAGAFALGTGIGCIGAMALIFPILFKYPQLDWPVPVEQKNIDTMFRRFFKWYAINLIKHSEMPNKNLKSDAE